MSCLEFRAHVGGAKTKYSACASKSALTNTRAPGGSSDPPRVSLDDGESQFIEANRFVEELRRRGRRWRRSAFVATLGLVGTLYLLTAGWSPALLIVFVLTAIVAIELAYLADVQDRTTTLLYAFDPGRDEDFNRLLQAFGEMMKCSRIEAVEERSPEGDFQSIRTKPVELRLTTQPSSLQTNIATPSLRLEDQSLYFLPDCVLHFGPRHDEVRMCPYERLVVERGESPVVERTPPDDVKLLREPLAGGPATEFSVVLYEWLRLVSPSGAEIVLHFSRRGAAAAFVEALAEVGVQVREAPARGSVDTGLARVACG